MRVELRDEAYEDLADVAEFYDSQVVGAGERYLLSVLRDVEKLAYQAGMHQVIHGYHCKTASR